MIVLNVREQSKHTVCNPNCLWHTYMTVFLSLLFFSLMYIVQLYGLFFESKGIVVVFLLASQYAT